MFRSSDPNLNNKRVQACNMQCYIHIHRVYVIQMQIGPWTKGNCVFTWYNLFNSFVSNFIYQVLTHQNKRFLMTTQRGRIGCLTNELTTDIKTHARCSLCVHILGGARIYKCSNGKIENEKDTKIVSTWSENQTSNQTSPQPHQSLWLQISFITDQHLTKKNPWFAESVSNKCVMYGVRIGSCAI